MLSLSELSHGAKLSGAFALSPDGAFIVGYTNTDTGIEGFIRFEDGTVRYLGEPTAAIDVSDDGRVVVGEGVSGAFYWNEQEGVVDLKAKLLEQNVEEVEGWHLTSAAAVSADGRTIVGTGYNPDGRSEAWIATIPEPSTLGFFLLAVPLLVTHRND
jgi:uncharacterized membrane protein